MAKMYVNLVMLVGIMSCFIVIGYVNAFTHIVGGGNGWRVPTNETFFEKWVKSRTFGVGDRLVFPYRPGANNLVVVNKQDFETCGQEDVIFMYFLGPTIVNLTAPGDYYYYCGIGKHCEAGQKLHIHVDSREGTSGSDPTPFKLESVGVNMATSSAIVGSSPAPAPSATKLTTSSNAVVSTEKLGLASAGMLFTLVLSMFI